MSAPSASSAPVLSLPPLPRAGNSRGDLSTAQSRLMVAGVVAAHVVGAWGLLQISAVREAVLQAAPMFVDLILPADLPVPPQPAPPPPKPVPDLKKPPPPEPLIAAAPNPAPASFVVPAPPPPELAPVVATQAVVAAPAPPAPPPPPAAPPKPLVATAAQFLEPPVLVYPRLSSKNNEQGHGMVLAVVPVQGGAPRSVAIAQGSGFARLDDAALGAVQKSRFRPLLQAATDTIRGTEFSVLVPFNFELEK